ncbi:MAG TPA: 16S rRNA (cytidine(1402)-2'-O)-methyltransferase [Terriglobia bacterium]|nr:16S rRNA (cytidine(1402)-2'-O)-methyltransferase [Terriglobia bacterium]
MPNEQTLAASDRNPGAPPGHLYVVGTPIGNLEDITLRALRVLKEADVVACEDTRRTRQLLDHYGIETPTVSYHDHNEFTRAPELIIRMEEGQDIALVSDAGMPLVSDPGFRLVNLAVRHGVTVIPVPGASALVATLAAGGLPVEEFRFVGFLPAKRLPRQRFLRELKHERALVFYEAPQRVTESLGDVLAILGDRPLVLAREVTKLHEEFLRGKVSEVLVRLKEKVVKGEITVLLGPSEDGAESVPIAAGQSLQDELDRTMSEQGIDERAALKHVAKARGISKSEAYRQWQSEKSAPEG